MERETEAGKRPKLLNTNRKQLRKKAGRNFRKEARREEKLEKNKGCKRRSTTKNRI